MLKRLQMCSRTLLVEADAAISAQARDVEHGARIIVGGKVERDVWRFRSQHGDFELKFRPKGFDLDLERRLMNSQQTTRVAGVFMGRVPTPDGSLTLEALPGICEYHRPD